jgi:hypothetical protein
MQAPHPTGLDLAQSVASREPSNGWRFSCGGPVPPQSQQKYSAASDKERFLTRSAGFPIADSYKRLLGLGRSEPELSPAPPSCHPACPEETQWAGIFALPAPISPAPRGHQGLNMLGSLAAGGASTELTTGRSPTQSSKNQAPTTCWTET